MVKFGQIIAVVSVLVVHCVKAQVFSFPNRVTYSSECGLENIHGSWNVKGTVRFTTETLDDCDTKVVILTPSEEICSIDLGACDKSANSHTIDACYCADLGDGEYELFVRRRPRTAESGLLIRAATPSRDIDNPGPVVEDIGTLPTVYDTVLATYSINGQAIHDLLPVQKLTVNAMTPVTLEFCATNLLPGSTLTISLDDQDTTTKGQPCVFLMKSYDFSVKSAYQVDLSFEESGGCRRTGKYIIHVEGSNSVCTYNPDATENVLLTLSDGSQIVCNTHQDGGKWTVILHRENRDVDFNQDWASYANGFGVYPTDFWYGLKRLHTLCNKESPCEAMFHAEPVIRTHYDKFAINGEHDGFRLVSASASTGKMFPINDGINKKFSTPDRDNDEDNNKNCAAMKQDGWWHGVLTCYNKLNTNMPWIDSNYGQYNIVYLEMKVRPMDVNM